MSRKSHPPETPATTFLRQHNVLFSEHLYHYVEHGGTAESSRQLGTDEHHVVKTLVMQDQDAQPLIILMHGDRKVSLKNLARQIGAKSVEPCKPEIAQRHTGYQIGGTSPFGTRKPLPVYVERSVLSLPQIFINGGNRGFLVSLPAGSHHPPPSRPSRLRPHRIKLLGKVSLYGRLTPPWLSFRFRTD